MEQEELREDIINLRHIYNSEMVDDVDGAAASDHEQDEDDISEDE